MSAVPEPARWQVIATELRREIEHGRPPVGQSLPSIPALMTRYDVSNTTAIRALRELRELGLVEARPGSGHRVIRDTVAETPEQRRLSQLERDVAQIRRHLGLPKET